MRCSYLRAAMAATVLVSCAFVAKAGEIVNFGPVPVSDGVPEFIFDGVRLKEGPGSIGDGNAATAPGLQISTPFIIPGIAGGVVNLLDGSTLFSDVTLDLEGFAASGPAFNLVTEIFQPLGPGTFRLLATDGTLLLAGNGTDAVIDRSAFNESGLVFSMTLTYTAGAIKPFIDPTPGSLSFSMLANPSEVTVNEQGFMNRFEADGEGHFSAETSGIPLPPTVWGGALLAAGVAGRRIWRRR
jgi:hypothetical protein